MSFCGDKRDGIYYAWITRKEWDEYLAANSGGDYKMYCYNYGEFGYARIEIVRKVVPETEYVFFEAYKHGAKSAAADYGVLSVCRLYLKILRLG